MEPGQTFYSPFLSISGFLEIYPIFFALSFILRAEHDLNHFEQCFTKIVCLWESQSKKWRFLKESVNKWTADKCNIRNAPDATQYTWYLLFSKSRSTFSEYSSQQLECMCDMLFWNEHCFKAIHYRKVFPSYSNFTSINYKKSTQNQYEIKNSST